MARSLSLILLSLLFLAPQMEGYCQASANLSFYKGFHLLTIDKPEALKHLSDAIIQDSTNAEAYYYRGLLHYKLDENDSALLDFNNALHYDSTLTIVYIYKGFAYRNKGLIKNAVTEFNTYLAHNPTDTSAYSFILRGKWKQQTGDYEGAVKDYDIAIALKPLEEKYHYYRFISMYNKGLFKIALKEINKVIEINSEFYGYPFYKGNTLFQLKEYEKSITLYNKSLALYDYNADAYFQRGQAYNLLNNYSEAIESYNMAIIMNPDDGVYYSRRGNSKYEHGDKTGACDDWDLANTLGYYEDYEKMKKLCK